MTTNNLTQPFAVMDMTHGGVVVQILPTFRRAKNASTRLNTAAGVQYGDVPSGWRYLITPARLVSAEQMFGIPAAPVASPVIHTFQTGRLYTAHGQRIAWTQLASGHVAMYDVDRLVDYVLRIDGEPTDRKVLAAYDGVSYSNPDRRDVPYNKADYDQARELQSALIRAGQKARSLAYGGGK